MTKTTWDSSSLNQILLQFVSAVSSDLNIMGDRVVLAELDVLPNSVPCVTFAVLDRFTLSETSGDQVAQQFQSRVQTTSDALRKDSQLLQCLSTPPVQVNITLVTLMLLPHIRHVSPAQPLRIGPCDAPARWIVHDSC